MPRLLPLATVVAALLTPAAAQAASTFTVPGAPADGPAKYDRTTVTRYGAASAKTVVILVPGTSGGAGDFSLVAPAIVKQVPGVQVWATDRREQALEDVSGFRGSAADAKRYYLDWIADPSITDHYQPLKDADFGFVRDWGLRVAMDDLHRVVLKAKKAGKRVILGGHSLGASETTAYATWDFAGRAGWKDLDGLMLIDGGSLGGTPPTPAAVRTSLADLKRKSPFLDLLAIGLPWASGAFTQIGGLAVEQDPTGPSILQSFPLLPAQFKPPVPATSRGQLGFALDETTSPKELGLIHVRAGTLDANGDWVDGEVSPIANVAKLFAATPNAVDWYYPQRLSIDVQGGSALKRNANAQLLGLRTWHLASVDLPMYAIQTSLSGGRVAKGARTFATSSKVTRKRLTLVDASKANSHLDPLTAAPATSAFLKSVVPWLKKTR